MAVRVSRDVEVDDAGFLAHLHDFAKIMGKTMGEVIKQQAALFCRDMINYTPPFQGAAKGSPGTGGSSDAKRQGQQNIENQVRTIFRPLSWANPSIIAGLGREDIFKKWRKASAEDHRYATTSGKKFIPWSTFQQRFGGNAYGSANFIPAGDLSAMRSFHKANRVDNGHGWLTAAAKKGNVVAFVEKESDLKAYVREKQKSVAKLKAPYMTAGQKANSSTRFPAWVNHPEMAGEAINVDETGKSLEPSYTIGNAIGNKLNSSKFLSLVRNKRAFAMRSVMAAKMNKDGKTLWEATASGSIGGTRGGFQ
jgi:hypothetical protein